ncbi:acyl-desaturase [Xylariaceae sp. FL0255]|nr:acyl-desaturase [Xylariaceae sp. FL0255]
MDKQTTTISKPKVHIADQPFTWGNWYKKISWANLILAIFVPLAGFISTYWVPLHPYTAIFTLVYFFNTNLGVTAGCHRLWSHTSFKASWPLEAYLLAVAAGACEGSGYYWARVHRSHHRYTDTEKDPYWVGKGLFHAHIGWMVLKQDNKRVGRADVADLNQNRLLMWQHKHYWNIMFIMAYIFPTVMCGLWNDFLGGFIYAAVIRTFLVQQSTFCLNSLAHWIGEQPFDDRHTPRDNWFTAIVTIGDGYHNFHHEFPSDYRNGIEWYHFDPTKWAIWAWKKMGLASDLKEFRSNEIEKGRVQQLQKKLDGRRAKVDWGVPLDSLPVMEWDDFQTESKKNGRGLVAIAGVIHDVTDFIKEHPGGKALITSAIGKDATAMFNGGVYDHSNAAHNLLSTMRVGILRGGSEVEIWKRPAEKKAPIKDSAGKRIVRAGEQVTKVIQPIEIAGVA